MKRRTKIIATLGPVSESDEMLKKLIKAGVNVFRLNLSHNARSWHEEIIKRIRKISKTAGILIDTRGPEIRLGNFKNHVCLYKDESFQLVVNEKMVSEDDKRIPIKYKKFPKTVHKGDLIAIDGGMLYAEVMEIGDEYVECKALSTWKVSSRRHVNLPGERVDLPTIPQKDKEDLKAFHKIKDVEFVALSFVRSSDDIVEARKIIPNKKIIAKIENFEGVENFSEILKETDGIMIARGDLGVEMPIEKIPVLQRKMVRKAKKAGKFVIVATGMLKSMVENPTPARAEVSDIATAVWERADYTMLSDETTVGKYPIKAVETMRRVIEYTEEAMK